MNDDAQSAEPKPDAEPEPKQKRPWSKPRLIFIEMNFIRSGGANAPHINYEDSQPEDHIPGPRYRTPTS